VSSNKSSAMNLLSSLFVIIWAASALREEVLGSPRGLVEMKLAMHVKTTICCKESPKDRTRERPHPGGCGDPTKNPVGAECKHMVEG